MSDRSVKIGLFLEEMRQGLGQTEAFRDALRIADAAEASGLDGVWLGEMHCVPDRSVLSAPLLVATAIASRTRRLRVGTAVHLLPLNNPLRIAEEVATLDQVSEGRFEFGIGRSGSPRAYNAYGVPYAESQARFFEALEIIREAWKGKPFSYAGTFHSVTNTAVAPRPYQQPHPPIRMAALSEETFAVVARLGLQLFVGLRQSDIGEVARQLVTYRRAWKEAGHPGEGSVYLRIPLYAAPSERAARQEARETITYYFKRQADFTLTGVGQAGTGPVEKKKAKAAELRSLTYEHILEHRVAFGSAAGLVERLGWIRDEMHLDGIVVEMNPGGLLSADLEARSLRILADEVMPALA